MNKQTRAITFMISVVLLSAGVSCKQQTPAQPSTKTVSVYFGNSVYDPEVTCNKVFPVERIVPIQPDPMLAALEAMLQGPSEGEKTKGYFTSLNPGTHIVSLRHEEPTVYIDFDKQLDFQVGGSCRIGAIRAQITETAKQFPGVENVIISIGGNTDEILQP